MRVLRLMATAALCCCALAACGSSQWTSLTTKGSTPPPHDPHLIKIYVSLPLRGPQRANAAMIIRGIHVALSEFGLYKGEDYRIQMVYRDGTTSHDALVNAEQAAADPNAVLYIGDLDSSATRLSLPILNQAGIMQITPGSPYPGLTVSQPPVTAPGEARIYYPTHRQTLLRLIPNDLVQAAAAIDELKSLQCKRVAAASFGSSLDGPALVKAVGETAVKYGLSYYAGPAPQAPGPDVKTYPAYVDALRSAGVGCYVLTGRVTAASLALAKAIHAQLPLAPILGTSGLCNHIWLAGLRSDPMILGRLYCTSPIRPLDEFGEEGKSFAFAYRHLYPHAPPPTAYGLFGYTAIQQAIDAFFELTPGHDNRAAVRATLIAGTRFPAAVSEFTFDANGDLASHAYGLWGVSDGEFEFLGNVIPVQVL